MPTLQERLETATAQVETDTGVLNSIVHGPGSGEGALVSTNGGDVKTAAKAVADIESEISTQIGDPAAATTVTQAAAAIASAAAQNIAGGLASVSTNSLAIATGLQDFTIEAGKGFAAEQLVNIAFAADAVNFNMAGLVAGYDPDTGAMAVFVNTIVGTGTFSDWAVSLGGAQGPQGIHGPQGIQGPVGLAGNMDGLDNLSGLTDMAAARANLGLPEATQAEAEAGEETAPRSWSPRRLVEAVLALTPRLEGEVIYTDPGEYSFVPPSGVNKVSVVAVGSGGGSGSSLSGGGGGALAYANDLEVMPGEAITIIVGAGGGGGDNDGSTSQVSGRGWEVTAGGGAGARYTMQSVGGGQPLLSGSAIGQGGGGNGGIGGGYGNRNAGGGGGGGGGFSEGGGWGEVASRSWSLDNSNALGRHGGGGGRSYEDSPYGQGAGGGGHGGEGLNDAGEGAGGGGGGSRIARRSSGGRGGNHSGERGGTGGYPGGGAGGSQGGSGYSSSGADGAVRIIWGNRVTFPEMAVI